MVTRPFMPALFGIAITVVSFTGAGIAAEGNTRKATVCDVLEHSETFDSKIISVHATFIAGTLEHMGIIDMDCKGRGGISIVDAASADQSQHLIGLAKAIQRARIISTSEHFRTVEANLVGMFIAVSKSTGGPTLFLRDASAIRIVPWTQLIIPPPKPG